MLQIAGEKVRMSSLQSALTDLQGTAAEAAERKSVAETQRQQRLQAMEAESAETVAKLQAQHTEVWRLYTCVTSIQTDHQEAL